MVFQPPNPESREITKLSSVIELSFHTRKTPPPSTFAEIHVGAIGTLVIGPITIFDSEALLLPILLTETIVYSLKTFGRGAVSTKLVPSATTVPIVCDSSSTVLTISNSVSVSETSSQASITVFPSNTAEIKTGLRGGSVIG